MDRCLLRMRLLQLRRFALGLLGPTGLQALGTKGRPTAVGTAQVVTMAGVARKGVVVVSVMVGAEVWEEEREAEEAAMETDL